LHQMIDEEAIAAVGRHATCGGMRLCEISEILEVGHDVAQAGRRKLELPALRQRAGADRLARRHVLENDRPQHVARAAVELVTSHLEFRYHRSSLDARGDCPTRSWHSHDE